MANPINLLTIDLEEWFVVEALANRISFDDWPLLESTLVDNVHRLLKLFRVKDVPATWFVLGWCAEKFPHLIRQIADDGHEIACHSYQHRRVDQLTPDEFRDDTKRAIDAIVKAIGRRPMGYRAPSWSMNNNTPWAFEILEELGFTYDSSVFPVKHDIYGLPNGPRKTFRMKFDNGSGLYEIPATTIRLLGRNIPAAGGGFFRHSPYWYSRSIIRSLNVSGQPAVSYFHPWELDSDPPQMEGLSLLQRIRSYGSTSILYHKISRLLDDFNFTTMDDYIRSVDQPKIGFR